MGNGQSAPRDSSSAPPPPPASAAAKEDQESKTTSPSTCPVDPAAREAWLAAAAEHRQNNDTLPPSHPSIGSALTSQNTAEQSASTSSTLQPRISKTRPLLGSDRVISTIPRASSSPLTTTPSPSSRPSLSPSLAPSDITASPSSASASPSPSSPNAQTALPATSATGNWIYPSEKMFFDAMKRKQHSPQAEDMAVVVPIHNAVNERAWSLIKRWEQDYAAAENQSCGGPRLRSFSGDSSKLTPKARWNVLCGYEAPFDRHDWVVERCEKTIGSARRESNDEETGGARAVEYVIDFYRGRESAKGGGRQGGLNFYLDVRPKLNSWEGCRMRMRKFWGL